MRQRTEILRDAEALYRFLSDSGERFAHADILLAAGSHDLRVPEYAASLYALGAAPLLVCTGGFGKMTSELFSKPEGELFAEICREHGVPEEALLVERRSTNTGENFTFSRELLRSRGLSPAVGIIVCKPYMAKRCLATGRKQWPELSWSVSVPPLSFEAYLAAEHDPEQEIELMVGDLQRLRVYPELGFQTPVEVPEAIWATGKRLAADGYDRYVMADRGW